MKNVMFKVFVALMRCIFLLLRPLHIQNKISMFSRQSDNPSADFLIIRDWLHQELPDVNCVILTKTIENHIFSYPFHVMRQLYHISTSKLIILDGYCIAVSCLNLKKRTKVMQIWHASAAIKKFGRQVIGKKSGYPGNIAETMCMHKNYDYVPAPSKETAGIFSEGFGTDLDKFRICLLPHIGEMVSNHSEKRREVREKYEVGDRELILYAPTFRKGKSVPAESIAKQIDYDRFALIYKPHSNDDTMYSDENIIVAEKSSNVYELMCGADSVITDYSSIVIEAMILQKKLFLFVYDEKEYKDDPGLNIDYRNEGLGDIMYSDHEKLCRGLTEEYDTDIYERFKQKYVEGDYSHIRENLMGIVKECI